MESLEEIVSKLPPEHQQEVRDNALFLAEKRSRPKRWKLQLDRAEGLKEFAINTPLRSCKRNRLTGGAIDVPGRHQCMTRASSRTAEGRRGAPVPRIGQCRPAFYD
jgi:hypothetical protein